MIFLACFAICPFPLSENEGYDQNLYSAEGLPTYFESGLLYYMLELNCSFMTQPYGFYFLMFESTVKATVQNMKAE